MTSPDDVHLDVGAYVLGILDPAERERFEAHLAECPQCLDEAEQLGPLEPMLAELAATGGLEPLPPAPPEGRLLDTLVTEVATVRRRGRVRRLVLAACAALLILGGPAVTLAVTEATTQGVAVAQQFSATDPTTGVSAKVGVTAEQWGSRITLNLAAISGPRTCDLVAVSRTGEQQTVTTWTVPATGYGTESLKTGGGSGLAPGDIDHFEVRTLDGDHQLLVTVPAHG